MRFTILNKVFGSGTPPSGNKFAFLAKLREIEYFPKPDSLGVVLLGDIKMKENCGMMQLYITPSSQEYGYEISGDADSKGFKVKFTGTHPGTEQQALEFVTNYLEEEFVILIPDCKKGVRVLGTPDVPLIFTSTHKSTKDTQKFNFVFEQEVATDFIYHLYDGIITLNENIDIDMSDFLEALRSYMKIDGSNLSEAQKQNLRDILGVGGSNIANSDLSLSENRSLNLKNYFLNFFSNSGKAKVGINKNNPDKALEVVGGANIDALVLGQNNETNALSREGNIIYINTPTGKKKLVQEGDYVMDDYGIILPDTAAPVGGWAKGWYTPGTSSEDNRSVDPNNWGTLYPNQGGERAKAGFSTKFYFNGTTWQKVEVELPSNDIIEIPFSTVISFAKKKSISKKNLSSNINYTLSLVGLSENAIQIHEIITNGFSITFSNVFQTQIQSDIDYTKPISVMFIKPLIENLKVMVLVVNMEVDDSIPTAPKKYKILSPDGDNINTWFQYYEFDEHTINSNDVIFNTGIYNDSGITYIVGNFCPAGSNSLQRFAFFVIPQNSWVANTIYEFHTDSPVKGRVKTGSMLPNSFIQGNHLGVSLVEI